MKKRILFVLLALVMVLALLPIQSSFAMQSSDNVRMEQEEEGFRPAKQQLYYDGTFVEPVHTLDDYGITKGYIMDRAPIPLTTYAVKNDEEMVHGTVTASPTEAAETDTITLTVTPDKGYLLQYLFVLDENDEPVEYDEGEDNTYTFTMPASDVTVIAEFITQWTWLQQQFDKENGGVILDRDIVCVDQDEGPLTVPSGCSVTLDLNGHTVDRNLTEAVENGNVITVMGELTLLDSSNEETGKITGGNNTKDGGGVLVWPEEDATNEGHFIMEGGTITQNTARSGGGVYVWDNYSFHPGRFDMYGGMITGNLAIHEEDDSFSGYGGGVTVDYGQFYLYDGEISNNHAGYYGGGVYIFFWPGINDTFVVSGAPIVKDNTCGNPPKTNNVAIDYGDDSYVITVGDDGLDSEASIGVSIYMWDFETWEHLPCLEPFTKGLADNGGSASNFVSDLAGYTVTLNDNGEAMLTEVLMPKFASHSLVLSGKIGVNFFMDLPEIDGIDYSESYMTFTISGKGSVSSDPVLYDPSHMSVKSTYYGFSCYVNSIQMADTITATFHYGDGLTVSETYSVKQYIESFDAYNANPQNVPYDDETIALVHALADYGHYVQPFLAATRGWTVGDGDDQYAEMTAVYAKGYNVGAIKTAVADYAIDCALCEDIEEVTYSLLMDSDTAIYLFIKPITDYDGSFTVEGYTATKQKDGRYLVKIPNIGAHKLGDSYTVVITTAKGESTVTVSAMSYVKGVLDAYTDDQTAQYAAAAIYAYYKAAIKYQATH